MYDPPTKNNPIRDLIALTKPRLKLFVVITTAGGWWLAPSQGGWLKELLLSLEQPLPLEQPMH